MKPAELERRMVDTLESLTIDTAPVLVQVPLGFVRQVTAMSREPRPDIVALLAETTDLPDNAVVQITKTHVGILADEDDNLLEFGFDGDAAQPD